MRRSRTDLVPVLAIIAGGVIGASLSFSFVALSRSDDVPGATLGLLYESSTTKESARRLEDLQRLLELGNDRTEEVRRLLERDRVERVEATLESVRDRVEELQRVLERISAGDIRQLRSEARQRVREALRLREELQEGGWDVTSQPPVFRLPEIHQLTRER